MRKTTEELAALKPQILALSAQGASGVVISKKLGVSSATVHRTINKVTRGTKPTNRPMLQTFVTPADPAPRGSLKVIVASGSATEIVELLKGLE